MTLTNWKDFYDYMCPKDRQSKFYKKIYRKLFSLIARNRWVCEKTEHGVIVKHSPDGFELSFYMSKLDPNARWTKMPTRLSFTNLTSLGGLKLSYNLNRIKVQAIELSDGTIEFVNYNSLQDLIRGNKNVKAIYPSLISLRNEYVKNNPKDFLEIKDYFKDGTFVLVLKDFLTFKRGQIIKTKQDYGDYRCKRSPNEVLNEYCSITTTIECDLNLELDVPTKKSCIKQQFGCQRGCTSYCFTDSENRAKMELYKKMKKYKEFLSFDPQ